MALVELRKHINMSFNLWLSGLAALVQLYVQAINTPGVIPNVQNAWDTFVENKCSATIKDALDTYEVTMTSQLENELPCENDQLRRSHGLALKRSEDHFMAETAGISTNTIEKYLKKLKVRYALNVHKLVFLLQSLPHLGRSVLVLRS